MDYSEMIQQYVTHSPEETRKLGKALGEKLSGGEVLAFTGGMGMGKTVFTQGLVLGLGCGDVASSPTFALVNEYSGRLIVEHFDMYRVNGWDDLFSTGFFDYLDSERVLIIEWSENIEAALPETALRIEIAPGERDEDRIIQIKGWKERLIY